MMMEDTSPHKLASFFFVCFAWSQLEKVKNVAPVYIQHSAGLRNNKKKDKVDFFSEINLRKITSENHQIPGIFFH